MSRRKQSFLRNLLQMRLFFVVNILILFFLVLSFGQEFARNHTIQKEINDLQERADSLQAENIEIASLHGFLQTELFLEREARLKLGLQKPGEKLLIIDSESTGEHVAVVGEEIVSVTGALLDEFEEPVQVANYKRWWYYFFNKERFNTIKEYERTNNI